MSTKNIARTAIEGGRAKHSKALRKERNRLFRHQEHATVQRILRQVDADDYLLPQRYNVRKDFADKLTAPTRWLIKHGLGKTHKEIQGLILKRFDTRTLAGRHIVYGHLMLHLFQSGSGERQHSFFEGRAAGAFVDGRLIRMEAAQKIFEVAAKPGVPGVARLRRKYRIQKKKRLTQLKKAAKRNADLRFAAIEAFRRTLT